MKVTVVRSGGVAGLVTTTTVDAADLPADAAAALRRTVAACSFAGPSEAGPGAVRDGFAYEVAVVGDDGDEHRVRFAQGRAPEGVDGLLRWVDESPHASRELGR